MGACARDGSVEDPERRTMGESSDGPTIGRVPLRRRPSREDVQVGLAGTRPHFPLAAWYTEAWPAQADALDLLTPLLTDDFLKETCRPGTGPTQAVPTWSGPT